MILRLLWRLVFAVSHRLEEWTCGHYDHSEDCDEPHLGLATTRQLLDEIAARIDVDGANGGGGLDYRTVTGRPQRGRDEAIRPEAAYAATATVEEAG